MACRLTTRLSVEKSKLPSFYYYVPGMTYGYRCISPTHIISLDERKRPVLERTAAVALGVDVRHLLQLEGPLHGDRLAVPLAQHEAVALVLQPGCPATTTTTQQGNERAREATGNCLSSDEGTMTENGSSSHKGTMTENSTSSDKGVR